MITVEFSQSTMEILAYNYLQNNSKKSLLVSNMAKRIKQIENINYTKENTHPMIKKIKKVSISFSMPVKNGITTSVFGDRENRLSIHKGHDFAVPCGTKVRASMKGKIIKAYFSTSYGYNVLIRHNKKYETRYAHLNKILVLTGEIVRKNQVIGLSGSTGDSTGPHLHFEVIKNGNLVDPRKYLNAKNN